jgi:hypothetical protein
MRKPRAVEAGSEAASKAVVTLSKEKKAKIGNTKRPEPTFQAYHFLQEL